ncbi:docking protein 2 isoform X2 [Apus apus]|uniref:docking protein 2 isoform X2 n=1 Tax=Apus apus TaxID=8895 RepID=UPI0021F91672|nr:docking protein 2 isoform X2 [Apus apus]
MWWRPVERLAAPRRPSPSCWRPPRRGTSWLLRAWRQLTGSRSCASWPSRGVGRSWQQARVGSRAPWGLRACSPWRKIPSTAPGAKEFEVTVRTTESSERCRLRGRCVLQAGGEALELRDCQTLEVLYSWPYPFLRRFGRDKVTFSFEAGRRCASGEGNFEFETRQSKEIFQAIESAINLHRSQGAEEPWRAGPGDDVSRPLGHARMPSWAQGHEEPAGTKCPSLEPTREGKVPKAKPVMPPSCSGVGEPASSFLPSCGADSSYAEPCKPLLQGNPPALEKGQRQDALPVEPEYAVPFDTIAKTLVARKFGSLATQPKKVLDPLYNSIGEARAAGGQQPPPRPTTPEPDHIYDEPEGLSPQHTLYDEPEEVKGEAWRLQATPEEPPGHEYPYDPQRDDYAVPKKPLPLRQPFLPQGKEWLGDTEYDNVAFKFVKKRHMQ